MGAGAVRTVAKVGLLPGLLCAVALLLGAVTIWLAAPKNNASHWISDRNLSRFGVAVGVTLVGIAWSSLYSQELGAMAAYYGCDGGSHLGYRREFVESSPNVYAGFVSLYSATHLLERFFGMTPVGSLGVAFYSMVAVVVVVPVIVASTLLQKLDSGRGARFVGLGAFALTWAALLKSIVLPLLSNMQVDGFYAHFFGFLPFGLVWLADVIVVPVLWRMIWTAAAVALCRFTYGLNLADLFVACALCWSSDILRARRRLIPLVWAVGAAVAAAISYRALAPIFKMAGYVEHYPILPVVEAMWLALLVIGAYAIADSFLSRSVQGLSDRFAPLGLFWVLRLPLFFALASVSALHHFQGLPDSQRYYLTKYPMMPLVWLIAAGSIAFGHVVASAMIQTQRSRKAFVGLLVALALGNASVSLAQPFSLLREEFAERNGTMPHAKLRPLVDFEALRIVRAVLTEERKSFGGLVAADFPVAHFLNVWLGHQGPAQVFVPPAQTPGHCVFWVPQDQDPAFAWTPDAEAVEATRTSLASDPQSTCDSYPTTWTLGPRVLCHRCY